MATKSSSRTRSAGSSSSSPPAKRQKTTVAPFAASFPRRTLLSSSRWVNKISHDIWVYKILNPFLDLKALATVGRSNTFFQEYWQYVLKQNVIRVPEGCPTMNQALDLAVVFSERNECTRENPVKVEVGEGEHAMVGDVSLYNSSGLLTCVGCSNITIVGKGKGKTTILGGFFVNGRQNVKMEQLAVTNKDGFGNILFCNDQVVNVQTQRTQPFTSSVTSEVARITAVHANIKTYNVKYITSKRTEENVDAEYITSTTSFQSYGLFCNGSGVDVTECCFKQCQWVGMCVQRGATVTATDSDFMENGGDGVECWGVNTKVRLTDCKMHHNRMHGLYAYGHAVVDLHGTKTDIHSIKGRGISVRRAKVNIHLPSQHNTTHDNVDDNRYQGDGGSIANINADGTFTHVEEV
jgi:hypothetical protein